MSPTVFTVAEAFCNDFAELQLQPLLCDIPIVIDTVAFYLPSTILRPRSPYFSSLLSPPWYPPPSLPLSKPNTNPPTFRHLLHYLITSFPPTPLSIPQTLSLYFLANELHTPLLETNLLSRISTHLTVATFLTYLHHLNSFPTPPPPPLEEILVAFVAAHVNTILQKASGNWPVMRILWRMLVNSHASGLLNSKQVSTACRVITRFCAYLDGKVLHLPDLLATEPCDDRALMLDLLLHALPLTFSTSLQSLGLFSEDQVLEKYHRDALVPVPRREPLAKYRVLCEIPQPHVLGARLETSVKKVVVPYAGRGMRDTQLMFDDRCGLGGGAELAFYVRDPALGGDPFIFLVGSRLQVPLLLPGTTFWYAFSSPDEDIEGHERKWRWRFFAAAVPCVIDEVD